MNLIFLYALLFVAIPLGAYFLFAFIIIFHLEKYGMQKRFDKKVQLVFCLGLTAISLMLVLEFFAVDWKRLDAAEFIGNADFNIFYEDYA